MMWLAIKGVLGEEEDFKLFWILQGANAEKLTQKKYGLFS